MLAMHLILATAVFLLSAHGVASDNKAAAGVADVGGGASPPASPDPRGDAGGLLRGRGGRAADGRGEPQDDLCPGGWVRCLDGDVPEGEFPSCEEVCDGKCCVGAGACDGFTGSVCRDGTSCNGDLACNHASIDKVHRGCNGKDACRRAKIHKVHPGCNGDYACYRTKIGEVHQGCNGDYACDRAEIGEVHQDCNGMDACAVSSS